MFERIAPYDLFPGFPAGPGLHLYSTAALQLLAAAAARARPAARLNGNVESGVGLND